MARGLPAARGARPPDASGQKFSSAQLGISIIIVSYLSDWDGKNPKPVLPPAANVTVDEQFFSPDGQTLVYNALVPVQPAAFDLSWLNLLMGVGISDAYNVPPIGGRSRCPDEPDPNA